MASYRGDARKEQRSNVEVNRRMIDPEDAMIAGIALINDESVLTRNVEHFSRIRDLKIETY